jgi:Ca2+/Na+ antiporter
MGSPLFWQSLAVMFLCLCVVNLVGVYKLDEKLASAREAFKNDYGFNTYEVFEVVSKCFKFAGWITGVGFLLAALAALAT